jgi:hypothetical protein
MVGETLNSYRLTLDYLRRLVADVPDADLARQPSGVVNHPAWVIGHLTFSCQALGGEFGLAAWLPQEWEKMFGTGSVATPDRSAYLSKAELLAALADGQARVSDRVTTLGDARMSGVLPDERYRATFPTLGHAVVHVLTSHAAVHVGQVSAWRRAAGYQPLSEIFV